MNKANLRTSRRCVCLFPFALTLNWWLHWILETILFENMARSHEEPEKRFHNRKYDEINSNAMVYDPRLWMALAFDDYRMASLFEHFETECYRHFMFHRKSLHLHMHKKIVECFKDRNFNGGRSLENICLNASEWRQNRFDFYNKISLDF